MKSIKYVVLSSIMGSLLAASSAWATSFNITSDHCTNGCGTPPFGTVTVTQNGTTVDITVEPIRDQLFLVTWQENEGTTVVHLEDYKMIGTRVTLRGSPAETFLKSALDIRSNRLPAYSFDPRGNFSFGIICTTCGGGGSSAFSDDIVFHVANATIADLTAPNAAGNIFVADVLAPNGNTGPVDVNTGGGNVPDGGATAALLGLGLAGLGGLRARFGRN